MKVVVSSFLKSPKFGFLMEIYKASDRFRFGGQSLKSMFWIFTSVAATVGSFGLRRVKVRGVTTVPTTRIDVARPQQISRCGLCVTRKTKRKILKHSRIHFIMIWQARFFFVVSRAWFSLLVSGAWFSLMIESLQSKLLPEWCRKKPVGVVSPVVSHHIHWTAVFIYKLSKNHLPIIRASMENHKMTA